MDATLHTLIAVGSLALFYFIGKYFGNRAVTEEAVDYVLHMLEKDGFIRTAIDKDGDKELIPISQIVADAVNFKTQKKT
tara:strand:+ start:363 stop:599 length:237 start_codon:yes stop_codon:yes gene_type:complete